jgi:hypothetical protein
MKIIQMEIIELPPMIRFETVWQIENKHTA